MNLKDEKDHDVYNLNEAYLEEEDDTVQPYLNVNEIGEPAAKKGRTIVKKPTSKWVLYLSEHRAECAQQNPDLSFAEITKVLAEGYKNITTEESERLNSILKDQKEKYDRYIAESRENADEGESESGADLIFPLARIKKLMKYDPDVKNVSKEATVAVTKCTEMFLARLALKAFAYTNMRSAKTVTADDLLQAIHTIEAFDFLIDDFPKKTKAPTAGVGLVNATKSKKTAMVSGDGEIEETNGATHGVSKSAQNFFLPRETGKKHQRHADEEDVEGDVGDDNVPGLAEYESGDDRAGREDEVAKEQEEEEPVVDEDYVEA
eukprot:gene24947-30141_t